MCPGLASRLERTQAVVPGVRAHMKFKIWIEDLPWQRHMGFLCGAVLAAMKDNYNFWLLQEEGVPGERSPCSGKTQSP